MAPPRVFALACLLAVFTATGVAQADVPPAPVTLTGTYFEAHVDDVMGGDAGYTFQLVTAHGAYDLAGPVNAESGRRVSAPVAERLAHRASGRHRQGRQRPGDGHRQVHGSSLIRAC
jgi:hypothetical protein